MWGCGELLGRRGEVRRKDWEERIAGSVAHYGSRGIELLHCLAA